MKKKLVLLGLLALSILLLGSVAVSARPPHCGSIQNVCGDLGYTVTFGSQIWPNPSCLQTGWATHGTCWDGYDIVYESDCCTIWD